MKRHILLLALSREHHVALKLALDSMRAAKSGNADMIKNQARRVVETFQAELAPHFRIEESGVLVYLARAGQDELVHRTLSEHAELRDLAARLERPDATALQRFAELLEGHVRFEEREMFETAQTLVDATGEDWTHPD